MEKISLRRFARNVYGYSFFDQLVLLMPVYAVFMQSRGVSDAGLSWLLILYPIAILITQMPATIIINRIGCKRAIIYGKILKCVAFFLWWAMPTYLGFGIGMFLWGVQMSFSGIAFDTLVYDELGARGAGATYTRVLGRKNVAASLGLALSSAGSILMFFGYGWITMASVTAVAISMIFILRMRLIQPPTATGKSNLGALVRVGFRLCATLPCVLPLMLLSLMVANFIYLEDYLGPISLSIGIPVEFIGIVPLFLLGCGVVGQSIAHKFNSTRAPIIYAAIFVTGAMFGIFAWLYSISGLIILGAAYFVGNIVKIQLYSRFQDSIPTQYRCILLSFHSLGANIANILVCLTIGLGGTLGSWRYGILILGMILIWIAIWAAIFVGTHCELPRKEKNENLTARLRAMKRKSHQMGCASYGINTMPGVK